jgi:hypothetical protein
MAEASISRRGMRDGLASVEHRLDVRFEIVFIDEPAGVRCGQAAFFVDQERRAKPVGRFRPIPPNRRAPLRAPMNRAITIRRRPGARRAES